MEDKTGLLADMAASLLLELKCSRMFFCFAFLVLTTLPIAKTDGAFFLIYGQIALVKVSHPITKGNEAACFQEDERAEEWNSLLCEDGLCLCVCLHQIPVLGSLFICP